jgi:hypothetical protein
MENEKIYRCLEQELCSNCDNNYYYASIASSKPILRIDSKGSKYYEMLCQTPDALDLSQTVNGQVKLYTDHEETTPLGYVDNFMIDTVDEKTVARIQFACFDLSQQYETEVKAGRWTTLSVGASILAKEKAGTFNDLPLVKITKWAPFHVALVGTPADTSVGINRSLEAAETPAGYALDELSEQVVVPVLAPEASEPVEVVTEPLEALPEAPLEVSPVLVEAVVEVEPILEEVEHTTELLIEETSIVEESTLRNLKKENSMENEINVNVTKPSPLDFGSEKSLRGYSVAKMLDENFSGRLTGLEAEVSEEMIKHGFKANSVPDEIVKRSLNLTDVGSGKEVNIAGNGGYVEAILAASSLGQLGMTDMGFTHDSICPRFSAISANPPALKLEKSGATSQATIPTDVVNFVSNEYTSLIQFSRRMLKIAAPGIDTIIMKQLVSETQKILEVAFYTTLLSEITKADVTATSWPTALAVTAALNLQTLVAADTGIYNGKYIAAPAVLNVLKSMSRNAANLPYPVNVDGSVWDQSAILCANMPLVAAKTPLIYVDPTWIGYSTFGQAPLAIETEVVQGGQGMINIIGYSYFDAHLLQPKAGAKIVTAV